MRILLMWYMVNIEVFELLCHVNGSVLTGHQVFISDFVLLANLINNESCTVCFEIFDSNLFSKLHPDQESIVFLKYCWNMTQLMRMHKGSHDYVGK